MSAYELPIIDLSPLQSPDPVDHKKVGMELCEAASTVGFFYIKNHGISQIKIKEIFDISKRFFAYEERQKSAVSISPFHRGWLRIGAAKMYGNNESDYKESFVWGLEVAKDDPDFRAGKRLLAPNQWPAFMPEMREKLTTYFAETQACGEKLLEAFAKGLQVPGNYFLKEINKPVSRGALIYYPPNRANRYPNQRLPKKYGRFFQVGSGEHTDYGTLTMLCQDQIGGLQIKGKSGTWVSAEPIEGTFVINIGDLLARWSNGRFESTLHRVINSSTQARYSLAMFVDPNWNATIKPLIQDGEYANYDTVKCADYINARYDEAFEYRKIRNE
ncbi:MAG: 2-oxoglutarate and iron-dependent oxygenase domain-containing protein [Pseudomonadota bacterium]|nr:2-oxoglutarate and iron-dependent oxygenase domain-containing protein [Pseudomonadota bacterium]